jgi:hypothetical protein
VATLRDNRLNSVDKDGLAACSPSLPTRHSPTSVCSDVCTLIYRQLPEDAAAMYRLPGVLPGPDVALTLAGAKKAMW